MRNVSKPRIPQLLLILLIVILAAGCKNEQKTQKPFSIQDLVSIKNGSIDILKEEDFMTAQEPLLSPDGNNLLFTTYEPGIGEEHSEFDPSIDDGQPAKQASDEKHSSEEDEHASNTIIYTLDKNGKIKKQLETDGRIENSNINWLTDGSFVYLVSTPIKKEDEFTYLPERKTQLFSDSVKGKRKLLAEFTIGKGSSAAILDHGILAILNENTMTYQLSDIQTSASFDNLAANINKAISSYPKETDTTLLAISKDRRSYLLETTNKPLWNSDVFLHNLNAPTVKIASLTTDNSHFNYIAWDDKGIYLQGFREGDIGLFYKYNDGILTKKEFPKDLNNCRNFAAGRLTYETINYPDPDFLKVIPFDPDDNENIL